QTQGPPRNELADPSEPEDAERLLGKLDAAPPRPFPPPFDECAVRLRDVAREREQKPDRVLGRRDDVRLGSVGDDDPAPRRRLDVDVVHAHARAPDHLELVPGLDEVGSELCRRPDDDAVVAPDDLREVAGRVDVDVETGPQELDAGLGDLLAHENLQAFSHAANVAETRTNTAKDEASTLYGVKCHNCSK